MFLLIVAATLQFNASMSAKELKETGVHKLSAQEKLCLQEWLEKRYIKRNPSQNKIAVPVISEILKAGRFVRLSDETLWEVNPQDTPITQSWITPSEIKVQETEDPDYPHTLTNSLTGSIVKVRCHR